MPLNKNAFLRYRIIDQCLCNKQHKYPHKVYLLECLDNALGSVSASSFDKDIKKMKELFSAPIEFDRYRKGYYYTDNTFSLNKFPLTVDEITALDFSTAVLQSLKHTPLFSQFEAAIEKVINGYRVGSLLGKSDADLIQVEIPLATTGYNWIEKIYKAIIEKQSLKLLYQSYDKEAKEHIVSPYLLKEYRNRWYMVGYSSRSQNSIVFALDRIGSIDSCREKYYSDAAFNSREYFNYSFGVTHFHHAKPENVVLAFQPAQAKYILSQPLHHSQRTILQNEKETRIELNVFITQELIMTILSYGEGIKVLQPESLVGNIKQTIEKMKNQYP